MLNANSIVIAIQHSGVLTSVLHNLNVNLDRNFYIANRVSDVIHILKTEKISLLILSFRNNQEAINTLSATLIDSGIPVLCLAHPSEIGKLIWSPDCIIFSMLVDTAILEKFLVSRIKPILTLSQSYIKNYRNQFSPIHRKSSFVNEQKELSRYVIELDQKRLILLKIKSRIEELSAESKFGVRKKLMSIIHMIRNATTDNEHWEDFKLYFENVSPHLLRSLAEKHPCLTSKDIKYCCYLTMNMSNTDICHMFGISQESVRTHKYRLKKKMHLTKDQNLKSYVLELAKMKLSIS